MDPVVTDQKNRPVSTIVSIVVTVLTLGYMLPWMIAALRGKQNAWGVFWLTLLLGWTGVGWIVALVLACMPHRVVGFRRY
ncbi:MAG TPA: superinfection immunity protein [Nocardioides sp.]